MSKTIYWAVLLDKQAVELIQSIGPKHNNIFAEHTTLCFQPTPEQDKKWMERLGERVVLTVIGRGVDDRGDALIVDGVERDDAGIPHITISCADGTKPFYSNELLAKGYEQIWPFTLEGTISRYTKEGWDNGEEKNKRD